MLTSRNLSVVEPEVAPPNRPFVLVGLEPGLERNVRIIEVESFDHALFVVQEGTELGAFAPVWIESSDGLIVYMAEQLFTELRKRQARSGDQNA